MKGQAAFKASPRNDESFEKDEEFQNRQNFRRLAIEDLCLAEKKNKIALMVRELIF